MHMRCASSMREANNNQSCSSSTRSAPTGARLSLLKHMHTLFPHIGTHTHTHTHTRMRARFAGPRHRRVVGPTPSPPSLAVAGRQLPLGCARPSAASSHKAGGGRVCCCCRCKSGGAVLAAAAARHGRRCPQARVGATGRARRLAGLGTTSSMSLPSAAAASARAPSM